MNVIRTEQITKRYGRQTAVDGVDLKVPEGKVFALMGRNGAGKTSLIRMLLGLTPISGGRAEVLGLDSAKKSVEVRARVGYVPEAHHMYRWMTVAEIVRFTAAFYPTWNDALCAELLRKFNLDPAKRIKELSRGMVAKTALTLALAHEPRLLILDEPTDGLDAVVRKEFLESIVSVAADEGRTVVISSHLLQDVERVADRVALMDGSRLRFVEDTESLKERVREVKLTFAGDAPELPVAEDANLAKDNTDLRKALPGLVSSRREKHEWLLVLDNHGPGTMAELAARFPGARIETRGMTLEDIFVALVGS